MNVSLEEWTKRTMAKGASRLTEEILPMDEDAIVARLVEMIGETRTTCDITGDTVPIAAYIRVGPFECKAGPQALAAILNFDWDEEDDEPEEPVDE